MVSLIPVDAVSAKRRELCSRENAMRVAARIFDTQKQPLSIIRTGNPFQPYRISTAPTRHDDVELEMLS